MNLHIVNLSFYLNVSMVMAAYYKYFDSAIDKMTARHPLSLHPANPIYLHRFNQVLRGVLLRLNHFHNSHAFGYFPKGGKALSVRVAGTAVVEHPERYETF
jgi:hypothetical protein